MPFPKTPSYSLGVASGVMAAGLAGASPIIAIRWATVGSYAVIRSLRLSAGGITAFTAGAVVFDLITARAWSVNDTGGGAVAWTNTASNRRRDVFADSGFATAGEIRASATATLTAGTRTLDTNPLAGVAASFAGIAPAAGGTTSVVGADAAFTAIIAAVAGIYADAGVVAVLTPSLFVAAGGGAYTEAGASAVATLALAAAAGDYALLGGTEGDALTDSLSGGVYALAGSAARAALALGAETGTATLYGAAVGATAWGCARHRARAWRG